jgi:predicted DNA-binding protein
MNPLTLTLDPSTEQRVAEQAHARGQTEAEFVRALIDEALDDLEDVQMATERLTNRLPSVSSAQARRALGLDD